MDSSRHCAVKSACDFKNIPKLRSSDVKDIPKLPSCDVKDIPKLP